MKRYFVTIFGTLLFLSSNVYFSAAGNRCNHTPNYNTLCKLMAVILKQNDIKKEGLFVMDCSLPFRLSEFKNSKLMNHTLGKYFSSAEIEKIFALGSSPISVGNCNDDSIHLIPQSMAIKFTDDYDSLFKVAAQNKMKFRRLLLCTYSPVFFKSADDKIEYCIFHIGTFTSNNFVNQPYGQSGMLSLLKKEGTEWVFVDALDGW